MLTVGLTGQIASGKSEVAKEWRRCGAVIISGDLLGRKVVAPASPALKKLARAFGPKILDGQGRLRRRELGILAFDSKESTRRLNRIVHPELLKKLRAQIRRVKRIGRAKMIVVDAALIFDWGLERELDYVVVVEAPRTLQFARLQRLGVDRREAAKRMRRQVPKYLQRQKADFVLRNDGTLADLKRRARALFTRLRSKSS